MMRLNLQLFSKPTTDAVVNDVIRGKYGNGEARKTALANAGYNYSEVQAAVNAKLKGNSGGTPKTNNAANANNSNAINNISGVDKSLTDKVGNPFSLSDEGTKQKSEADDSYNSLKEHINTPIVDQSVFDTLSTPFEFSDAYNQAFAMLQSQAQALQSGRTSWSDDIEDMFNQIKNRDKFVYDVDNDQLFQQALASAMNSGKTAMQDTIGQASALTGGYGSTYATSAGNQAYNAFIEDAYNNLPQYYQMALDAYRTEGEEMFNLLGAYMDADSSEWQKMLGAYDAQLGIVERIWNEDTFTYEAKQNQAMNLGTLQTNVWNSKTEALSNLNVAAQSRYEQTYKEEWDAWNSDVQNTFRLMELYHTEAWNQKDLDYKYDVLNADNDHWSQEFGLKQKDYQVSTGDTNLDGVLSAEEKAAMNTTYSYDDDGNVIKSAETDYENYINPDDVEVDADGNIIDIKGYNLGAKTPSVSGFRTKTGDNFKVTIGDKTYKVENEGKVTSTKTKESIKKGKTYGNITIADNGHAYIKEGNDYYRIGNLNGFLNIGTSTKSGYSDLLLALSK